jgi:hypothetical protein
MPNKGQEDLTAVRFGKLEPLEADSFIERTQAAGIDANAMDWIPNRRVLRLIPRGFRLPLQLVRGTDGLRRILPRCTAREFLVRAATGGLAVIQRVRKLAKDDRQSYRLMSLLFQWSFSDRRLTSRTIQRAEDLTLRRSERSGDSDRDILPDIEITTHPDKSKRLTPEELLSCGRLSSANVASCQIPFLVRSISGYWRWQTSLRRIRKLSAPTLAHKSFGSACLVLIKVNEPTTPS